MIIIPWHVDDNRSNGKPFKYKTKAMEKTLAKHPRPGNPEDTDQPTGPTLNVEVTIPLKCLSNFWGSLNLPLINCEVESDLL